jgi:hypothetical protein
MPLREFDDRLGRRWRVWDTVPARTEAMGDFREGWLTFDSGTDRRRLAPVPARWSEFPEERLILLLEVAHAGHTSGVRTPSFPDVERREAERRKGERRQGDRRRSDV